MLFEGVVFDFDGTIADTRKSILSTVKETLTFLGHFNYNEKTITDLIGLPLKDTFAALQVPAEHIERAIDVYRSMYNSISFKEIELFPDTLSVLQLIHDSKIKLALSSNKGRESIVKILDKVGIIALFEVILSEQDVKKKKPEPDSLFIISEQLNIKPPSLLMVGDTKYDIQMGQNAGIKTCAVTHGYGTKLEEYSPDYIIHNILELKTILGIESTQQS